MPDTFRIDPGPLTSISSFYKWSIKPLHVLSDLVREGNDVYIEWDLRSVEFQKINLGALATFLSTAYRVREYVTPILLRKRSIYDLISKEIEPAPSSCMDRNN